jgi:hypothetical protein
VASNAVDLWVVEGTYTHLVIGADEPERGADAGQVIGGCGLDSNESHYTPSQD